MKHKTRVFAFAFLFVLIPSRVNAYMDYTLTGETRKKKLQQKSQSKKKRNGCNSNKKAYKMLEILKLLA